MNKPRYGRCEATKLERRFAGCQEELRRAMVSTANSAAITASAFLDIGGQRVHAPAQVHRPGRHQHPHADRRHDHETALTARSTVASAWPSTAPRRRTTNGPALISISAEASGGAGMAGDGTTAASSTMAGTKAGVSNGETCRHCARSATASRTAAEASGRVGAPPGKPRPPGEAFRYHRLLLRLAPPAARVLPGDSPRCIVACRASG